MEELCFVHVPKNAGQSVLAMLAGCGPFEVVARGPNFLSAESKTQGFRLTTIGHNADLRDSMTLARYRREHNAHCRAFAIVRNPFDRLISAFSYLDREAVPYVREFGGDFGRFVRERLADGIDAPGQPVHLWSQTRWLCDGPRLVVNRLCRFETLARDLRALGDDLGLALGPLVRHNVGRHAPYAAYYRDEGVTAIVARLYARDFDLLSYDSAAGAER